MSHRVHVKLVGQPTSSYEYVKKLLRERAEAAHVEVVFEEVQDWRKIIDEGIPAIPTVKVNSHLMFTLDQTKDINEFVNVVSEQILQEADFGSMRKLIVPTDFSAVATNTLEYAQQLAYHSNSVLSVVHVHPGFKIEGTDSEYVEDAMTTLRREELELQIKQLNESWSGSPTERPLVEEEFRTGRVVDEINTLSKQRSNNLIVIGSKGRGSNLKRWFGSITTDIVKQCEVPVLVIPPEVTYQAPKRILYAFDQLDLDHAALHFLSEFASLFESEVHLVHIQGEREAPSNSSYELLKLWRTHYPKHLVFLHEVDAEDVISGLESFIAEREIDLVAMATKKRGFFQDLFHESFTRKMTLLSEQPLLILRQE